MEATPQPSKARGSMRANSEQLEYVQRRVAQGEYQVNSERVAEAMLARIGARSSERDVVSEPAGGRGLLQALTGLRAI